MHWFHGYLLTATPDICIHHAFYWHQWLIHRQIKQDGQAEVKSVSLRHINTNDLLSDLPTVCKQTDIYSMCVCVCLCVCVHTCVCMCVCILIYHHVNAGLLHGTMCKTLQTCPPVTYCTHALRRLSRVQLVGVGRRVNTGDDKRHISPHTSDSFSAVNSWGVYLWGRLIYVYAPRAVSVGVRSCCHWSPACVALIPSLGSGRNRSRKRKGWFFTAPVPISDPRFVFLCGNSLTALANQSPRCLVITPPAHPRMHCFLIGFHHHRSSGQVASCYSLKELRLLHRPWSD